MELTILIPALNEEKTIGIVIEKAKKFIEKNNISAEILVVNNGSTDRTKEIALNLGAKVVDFAPKGYGLALKKGIEEAKGKYIIMGDADDSYNFLELDEMFEKLKSGYDIVIGNRYGGYMEKGAMKFLHQYIGTPFFSYLIRKKYRVKIKDINCGLRGGKKESLLALECTSDGMEFASEMMIKAAKKNMKIVEVSINFYKDKREGKGNLRTIRDGLRHLKVILEQDGNRRNHGIFRYLKMFLLTLIICIISLVVVTMLPNEKVKEHCKEAAYIYNSTNDIFTEKIKGRPDTIMDYYADSIALSIIYSLDSNRPLSSVLEAKYRETEEEFVIESFQDLVEGKEEAQTEYTRYWHGYIVLLKPLLMFFGIEQIHIISAIVLMILVLVIMKQLWNIDKKIVIPLLIAFYMISIFIVPQCFEYTWVFMIAFIVSIIVLKIDNGDNKKLYPIFWITGMLTCFFDFLTVEMLTILLPLMFIIIKRNKQDKLTGFKDILKFIIASILIWGISYIAMYIAKWIIASIVLNKNYIIEAIQKGSTRINGEVRYVEEERMWIEAIRRNFNNLYPIYFIRKKFIIYILLPVILVIFLLINNYRHKNKYNGYIYGLLIIGLLPYARYILLPNHSCYHYIFTFRLQLVTIVCFFAIIMQAFVKKNKEGKELKSNSTKKL